MMLFLDSFKSKINNIKTRETDKNEIYEMSEKLVQHSFCFAKQLIDDNNDMDLEFAMKTACDDICASLSKSNSTYKREKLCKNDEQYVEPIPKSIGTRFEMRPVPNSPTKYPQRVQNVMYYFPIIDTLRKLFNRADFYREYIEFNINKTKPDAHVCQKEVYSYFCCGRVYQNNELFQQYPESIQLQLCSDDFETTVPIQSHATVYKITPIYCRVLNMPPRFASKTDNIFLVALCYTDDLKSQNTDFNNIWNVIKNDIRYLETIGIDIHDEFNIKGTVVSCVFDNLGARTALGFVESFRTSFYCYICEMPHTECKYSSKTKASYERTIEKYLEHLKIISESVNVDYSKTKGVKRECALNDLNYFHILKNKTLDIMHDCAEGSVMFLLKELFDFCFKHKIIKEKALQDKIKFFNFGKLSPSNHPSNLLMNKDNLNQNATQALCLFENIPFILWEHQNNEKIQEVWPCVTSLMRIIQCVYSYEITETDLNELEIDIEFYLKSFQILFNKSLKPKQHNMLHYPEIIRDMGPLKHYCMIRYEAKHKELKSYVNANFKNLTQSLAKKHQQHQLNKRDTYDDKILHGTLTNFNDTSVVEHRFVSSYFKNCTDIQMTKWLEYHSYRFQPGLFVLLDLKVLKIIHILRVDGHFYFLCVKYDVLQYHVFSNSLKLTESHPAQIQLISFDKVCARKPFEAKKMNSELYVKATTLEFKKHYI